METKKFKELSNNLDDERNAYLVNQLVEKVKTISGIDTDTVKIALLDNNPTVIIRGNDIVIANHSLPGFFGVLADFDEAHEAVAVN